MAKPKKPKILVWDLEFFASKNYNNQLKIYPGYLLVFACQELGKPKVTVISKRVFGGSTPTDDELLVRAIAPHLRDVDMHIFQYGWKTDFKFMQTRLLYHGLRALPEPPVYVDTCQLAQRKLALKSNSLESLARFFKLDEQKMPINEEQWHLAFAGHVPTMKLIEKRCASDVRLTGEVYKKLLELCDNHPSLYPSDPEEGPSCGACGETMVRDGTRATRAKGHRQRYRCTCCGTHRDLPVPKTKKGE